jgi:hypothetical protein
MKAGRHHETEGKGPTRAVLEAMALEGYRADRLTEADLKELLGFERMEVHGFLKDHGAFMHYTPEDLDHDAAVAVEVARRHRIRRMIVITEHGAME